MEVTSQMSYQQKQDFYKKDKIPIQTFSIDVIGVGKYGESCVMHINEFKPYFFIQLPPNITDTKIKVLLSKSSKTILFNQNPSVNVDKDL